MPGGSRDPLVVGRVIGDVLDPFECSIPMRVTYNNRDITNGCEFKPSQVFNQPRITIGGDDLRNFYTLVIQSSSSSSFVSSSSSSTSCVHHSLQYIIYTIINIYLYEIKCHKMIFVNIKMDVNICKLSN